MNGKFLPCAECLYGCEYLLRSKVDCRSGFGQLCTVPESVAMALTASLNDLFGYQERTTAVSVDDVSEESKEITAAT